MTRHATARCGACGGHVDTDARCFTCWEGWTVRRRVDRLIAHGVEINADGEDTDADQEAALVLSRVVLRFGVRRMLLAMSEGAACMLDLAKDSETGVVLEDGERRALEALARQLARAPEGS